MPDVVFSNRGALMKPSRASEVLPQFQFPSFELAFSDKTVEAMLAKDKEWARVRTQIGEATTKLYKTYKEAVEKGLVELDNSCKGKDKAFRDKQVQLFQSVLKRATDSVDSDMRQIPAREWQAWIKTRDQYKKYQYKTTMSIGTSALGVVASVISVGGAVGTYGATLPLTIVALARSSVGLATAIKDAALEVEQVEKVIRADAKVLAAAFEKGGKAALVSGSMGMAALQAVINTNIGPSMKSIKSNVDLWENKLRGLEVATNRMSGQITEFVDKNEELGKFVKSLPASSKGRKKLEEKVTKFEKVIAKLLAANDAMNARIETARSTFGAKCKPNITKLLEAFPKLASKFENLAPVAVNLGLAFGGTDYSAVAKGSLDGVKASLELGNEIVSAGKEVIKELKPR